MRPSSKIDLQSPARKELFEVLDRIVSYEKYYRSIYGNFTQLVSRIGIILPKEVSEIYEIRIAVATRNRLMVTAFSEQDGKATDLVSINQDYEVTSEFPLPAPRPEYLQAQARKNLRVLSQAAGATAPNESSVFRGYFRYEPRRGASGNEAWFAVGIQAPVEGIEIENNAQNMMSVASQMESDSFLAELIPEAAEEEVPRLGQNHSGPQMTTQEEALLAQKIFYGEMGRYAQTWSELTKITRFKFENSNRQPAGTGPIVNDLEIEEIAPEH